MIIFYLFYIYEIKFINISNNVNPFYIIPINKEGIKIDNLNKKSLNLNKKFKDTFPDNTQREDLNYSIQLFTSESYTEINNKINEYSDNTLLKNDMYVLFFDSSIGIEYFLLYKSFENKESALKYCYKYLKLLNNCVVLNAKNIN